VAATIGEGKGSARVGEERGGSHPSDRDQWPELALPSELPTPAEKCQKIYCFLEECLPKLQTPMPHNMKEQRKRNLTSFQKIGVSHSTPLKKNSSSNSTTSKQSIQGTPYSTTIQNNLISSMKQHAMKLKASHRCNQHYDFTPSNLDAAIHQDQCLKTTLFYDNPYQLQQFILIQWGNIHTR
jgi:hypothetical protein